MRLELGRFYIVGIDRLIATKVNDPLLTGSVTQTSADLRDT
jgi:hypothetical protein